MLMVALLMLGKVPMLPAVVTLLIGRDGLRKILKHMMDGGVIAFVNGGIARGMKQKDLLLFWSSLVTPALG